MKISTSFDTGDEDLCSSCDIKIVLGIEIRLKDIWQLPNVRDVIAESIAPVLRHLRMSERSIKLNQEIIRLSGDLVAQVQYPYRYDVEEHCIVDRRDKSKRYPVSDWLEGKLPD